MLSVVVKAQPVARTNLERGTRDSPTMQRTTSPRARKETVMAPKRASLDPPKAAKGRGRAQMRLGQKERAARVTATAMEEQPATELDKQGA